VSLDIKQGDRIGIIGRNGAGKSNFFKKIKLHCMTEPTCGKIFIKFIKGRVASLLKVGICLDSELTRRDNIELKQFRMVVLCTQTEEITENNQKDIILICQTFKDNLSLWKIEMPQEF
jgi:ABC-type polysaccharide/polyol phosphate transport system ATPase subunit